MQKKGRTFERKELKTKKKEDDQMIKEVEKRRAFETRKDKKSTSK